jgi:RimJ/RimL family protein N-acetyltransferase
MIVIKMAITPSLNASSRRLSMAPMYRAEQPAPYSTMSKDDQSAWYSFVFPPEVKTTRLVLRAFRPSDAPALKAAIDANLDHLQRWMLWAMNEPSTLEMLEERLALFAEQFVAGPEWGYAMYRHDEPAIIGSVGVHARIGARALEIGYWVDCRQTRRGYATEAAAALSTLALSFPDVDRLEIRCDPLNVASAGVPRRLGYRHVTTLEKDAVTPQGTARDTMVWALQRSELVCPRDTSSTEITLTRPPLFFPPPG